MPLKYFSLFSGIGGFEQGIGEQAQCVGFSEIDKYAISIYQSHFETHINYGDIRHINENELPDFDLLCGGFPCQAFSIAGKRGGFADPRGTLFFDIVRIIKAKQPGTVFLENVKGLLSHEKGHTFRAIIQSLDELGYDTEWQVLNSKDFGVPQNRERVFIIGHLRGRGGQKVFPITGKCKADIVLPTLTARYTAASNGGYIRTLKKKAYRVKIREATKQGFTYAEYGDCINLDYPNSASRRGRVRKQQSHTITTGVQLYTLHERELRRLTPTECERLQGFPDGWTKGVSDTQRYKTLGNAVTTNVIKMITGSLLQMKKT